MGFGKSCLLLCVFAFSVERISKSTSSEELSNNKLIALHFLEGRMFSVWFPRTRETLEIGFHPASRENTVCAGDIVNWTYNQAQMLISRIDLDLMKNCFASQTSSPTPAVRSNLRPTQDRPNITACFLTAAERGFYTDLAETVRCIRELHKLGKDTE